jgi:aldehyde:ferredoxin oxidoreductase
VPESAVFSQHEHMMLDMLPMCDFAFPRVIGGFRSAEEWLSSLDTRPDLELGARLLAAVTGEEWTHEMLTLAAERTFTLERAMLVLWGRDRKLDESLEPHYELPCKTDGTRLTFDEWHALLSHYYSIRGWSVDRGIPTRAKLVELGLDDVAERLDSL